MKWLNDEAIARSGSIWEAIRLTAGDADEITDAGPTEAIDVRLYSNISINVENNADDAFAFTVEGALLRNGRFMAVPYRDGADGDYVREEKFVPADGHAILFLPEADRLAFLRLNVSRANANGTSVVVTGRS